MGILIGTSGFSYDDWKGHWYPPDLPKAKMLDFYANRFPALEINSTYYRIPPRKSAEGMVRTAAGRLRWAIKVPGDMTHKQDLSPSVLMPFQQFLDPFGQSGSLDAVLLQFPNGLRADDRSFYFVEQTAAALPHLPLVVEFRHSSWDNEKVDAFLTTVNVSRAIVDQPGLAGLSQSARLNGVGKIHYIRFHGRNAANWYGENSDAGGRYAYTYSTPELEEYIPVVSNAGAKAQTTMVFFNNHLNGAAPLNAEMMASLLNIPLQHTGYHDLFS